MNESKEAGSEFVIAGSDTTELLEFEEELLYKMALLVKPPIDKPRVWLIASGRDAEIRFVEPVQIFL